ncbi:YybH family protein [Litchfieldella rifensis]|uniref:YybH family protein n=1 Tax=Litchfieldella rifensis TaxID=762643 RepID=A0ABV7LLT7_9GAMM
MTPLRIATLAVCIALLMPITVQAGSLEEDVSAAYAKWDATFNETDAESLASLYTEDTLFLPASHDIIKGPSGVEEFFAGLFANGVTGHKLELIEAINDGELVVSTAKWSAEGKDDAGAPAAFSGIATHVFKKQDDGSLRLKVHTFN